MNHYEVDWLVRDRLDRDRAFAAHQALIKQALASRPPFRLRLGLLLIRIGTWLQGAAADRDVEPKRATA